MKILNKNQTIDEYIKGLHLDIERTSKSAKDDPRGHGMRLISLELKYDKKPLLEQAKKMISGKNFRCFIGIL